MSGETLALPSFGWPAALLSSLNAGHPPPSPFVFFLSSFSLLFSFLLSVSFLGALILAPPRGVDLACRTWISGEARWRSGCAVPLVKRNGGGLDLVSDLVLWRALLLHLLPLFDFLGKARCSAWLKALGSLKQWSCGVSSDRYVGLRRVFS
ncbi:hypothetical protein DY000_02047073 [Brassica cretica]|uniref:Uncharacterized protein n=1 Tax=Brassica cretica TaxID=69181 RepID=A0ABQ7F9C7_BRACR|nr:hypothetical protein DY000_02047073 [Brassica cretica]